MGLMTRAWVGVFVVLMSAAMAVNSGADTRFPVIPPNTVAGASFGHSLGAGMGKALGGMQQLREASARFNEEIAAAREEYWELFPDKPGFEEAQAEFGRLLFTKDLTLMIMPLGIGSRGDVVVGGGGMTMNDLIEDKLMLGMDDGPPRGSRALFGRCLAALKNRIGREPEEIMLRMLDDPQALVAALDSVIPEYLAYMHMRDLAEFQKAGRASDFYPSGRTLLLDAVRFDAGPTESGVLTEDQARQQLQKLYELFDPAVLDEIGETLLDADLRAANGVYVMAGGVPGFKEGMRLSEAVVVMLAEKVTADAYLNLLAARLNPAQLEGRTALPGEDEFDRDQVLAVAAEVRELKLRPYFAMRRFHRKLIELRPLDIPGDGLVVSPDVPGFPFRRVTHLYKVGSNQRWYGPHSQGLDIFDASSGERLTRLYKPHDVSDPRMGSFGAATAMNDHALVVGAPLAGFDRMTYGAGRVFQFDIEAGELRRELTNPDPQAGRQRFGASVALTAKYAVISEQSPGNSHVFDLQTGDALAKLPQAGHVAVEGDRAVILGLTEATNDQGKHLVGAAVYQLPTGDKLFDIALPDLYLEPREFGTYNYAQRDLALDVRDGHVAIALNNYTPDSAVLVFALSDGTSVSVIRGFQVGENQQSGQMVLRVVGDRVYTNAKPDGENLHHVFDLNTGEPLNRIYYLYNRRAFPGFATFEYDGYQLIVKPSQNSRHYAIPPEALEPGYEYEPPQGLLEPDQAGFGFDGGGSRGSQGGGRGWWWGLLLIANALYATAVLILPRWGAAAKWVGRLPAAGLHGLELLGAWPVSHAIPPSLRPQPLSTTARNTRTLMTLGHLFWSLPLVFGAWISTVLLALLVGGLTFAARRTRGGFNFSQMSLPAWWAPHAGWQALWPKKTDRSAP